MTPEIMSFFEYKHLPQRLQVVSKMFYTMAHNAVNELPDTEERAMLLRKLLEAKDCAVRCVLQTESL